MKRRSEKGREGQRSSKEVREGQRSEKVRGGQRRSMEVRETTRVPHIYIPAAGSGTLCPATGRGR